MKKNFNTTFGYQQKSSNLKNMLKQKVSRTVSNATLHVMIQTVGKHSPYRLMSLRMSS